MNLLEFIASGYRIKWIDEPGLTYYVRKSILYPGLIELANVTATVEPGFGMWRFLRRYAGTIPFLMELVHNPDLAAYMRRLGWRETHDLTGTPTFYSPLADATYPLLIERSRRMEFSL